MDMKSGLSGTSNFLMTRTRQGPKPPTPMGFEYNIEKENLVLTCDSAEFLKVASARVALGATSPVVEPHLHP